MTTIASLHVTNDVLRDVVGFCRAEHPREACGFIVGANGVGTRVVPMVNEHSDPTRNYRMNNVAIVEAYRVADDAGEEILAAYHSHPNGPPILSQGRPDADLENAADTSIAYLVVSTKDPQRPTARAWRITAPFIGVREAEEIPLRASATGVPAPPEPPALPWALTAGNYVEITYQRSRGAGVISMLATVTGGLVRTASEATTDVLLRPRLKSGVNSLPIDRILQVQVITESDTAKEVRREAISCLRHAAAALSAGDVALVERLIAVPAAAFPAAIETSVRG